MKELRDIKAKDEMVINPDGKPLFPIIDDWKILGTKRVIELCNLQEPKSEWRIDKLFNILSYNLMKLINDQSKKGTFNHSIYVNFVDQIRGKWDAIRNKQNSEGLTDGQWSAFFATKVCKIGNAIFPNLYMPGEEYVEKERKVITLKREPDNSSKKDWDFKKEIPGNKKSQNGKERKPKVIGFLREFK